MNQGYPGWGYTGYAGYQSCHMRLSLVTPPPVEPLTAAEVKARLNIGAEISDQVIDAYVTASRQVIDGADGWLGRALVTQTWRGALDQFPTDCGGRINIPLPPLQSISQVSYLVAGSPVIIPPANYQVVMGPRPYLLPITAWPTVSGFDAISVIFIAGYGDVGTAVPEPIRTAISLGVSHLRSMTRNLGVSQEIEEGIGATRYLINADIRQIIDDTVKSLLSVYRVIWV